MKKQITIMLGIILALPLVMAMYGGESEVIEFGFETDNCTIVPNASEGINFTFSNNQVLVEPAINFVGSFEITCYDWLTKEVETQTSGSFPSGRAIRSSPLANNINETKDINYTELLDEVEEVIFDEAEQTEIESKDENHLGRVLGWTVITIVIGLLIWLLFKLKNEKRIKNSSKKV